MSTPFRVTLVLGLASALVAGGLAFVYTGLALEVYTVAKVGIGAQRCGRIGIGDSGAPEMACIRKMRDEGRATWVVIERMGFDSVLLTSLALRQQNRPERIDYEIGIFSRPSMFPRIEVTPCYFPNFRATVVIDSRVVPAPRLECD
ncbi:MAG: hypothetical protein HYZ17_08640 [Betaproteobacteria bacterium]|nr:hypothetical protein [Betaproteobacteria bacterium]